MDVTPLALKIAGEITLADNPGAVIRKWREIFNISQKDLARKMQVSSSVISDYESGRRKSPGTKFVAKLVKSLLEIDAERGGNVTRQYLRLLSGSKFFEAILAIKEFFEPKKVRDIVKAVDGVVYVGEKNMDNAVFGYTVIDSLKAILELSTLELAKIYGTTTQRALVFTGVTRGRSPILAIKLTGLKPAVVVLHGPIKDPDPLALELAKREGLTVVVSKLEKVEDLIERLKELEK